MKIIAVRLAMLTVICFITTLGTRNAAGQAGHYIQSCTGIAGGGASSCTLHSVGQGNLLVLLSFTCGSRGGLSTYVSDSLHSVWSEINASGINGNCDFRNTPLELDIATTTNGGDDTVTVNAATGNVAGAAYIVAEYSGVSNPTLQDPLFGTINQCESGCGSTASSGGITTTFSSDLLILGGAVAVTTIPPPTMSPQAPFALRNSITFPAGAAPAYNIYLADRISASPGLYSGAWTVSPAGPEFHVVLGSLATSVRLSPYLLDPVTDKSETSLLDGSVITSSYHRLAGGGRIVQGVGADGISLAVIAIPAIGINDQISITLLNDTSGQSTSSDEDGGLGQVGASSFTANQVTVLAGDTGGQGAYAFALYRAPVDFARSSGSDNSLSQRGVSLQVTNVTRGTTNTLPIVILRPPLALIHGLWGNWHAWDSFSPLVTGPSNVDSRFYVRRVNYDNPIGRQISLTDPVYPMQLTQSISENSLGYAYNAQRNVFPQVQQLIKDFKTGRNPWSLSVAAVQADIVGHSMGGLLARTLVLQQDFLSDKTYGQGIIHKVITVDTPHLGSQLAIQILATAENSGCVQKLFASKGNFALNQAALPLENSTVNGAVLDLKGDDTIAPTPTNHCKADGQTSCSLSDMLSTLNTSSLHPIPATMIAGVYQNFTSLDSSLVESGCGQFANDSLARMMTPTSYPTIFHNNPNDAIVSETSQLKGLIPSPGSQFFGYMHSPSIDKLGFTHPSVMDGGAIPTQVIFLLNTSWKNTVYYNMINP